MKKLKAYSAIAFTIIMLLSVTLAITQTHINSRIVQNKVTTIDPAKGKIGEDKEVPSNDDPWKELDRIVNAYYQKQGVNYIGSMKVIDANGDQEKVLEEESFNYKILGNDYQYQIGSIEMISKGNIILTIDHENKTVDIIHNLNETSNSKVFDLRDFKNQLEEKKASISVSMLGNIKILTVDNIQDPTIQGYRIYYTPDQYQIDKIEIGMVRMSPLDTQTEQIDGTTKATNQATTSYADEESIDIYTYYLEINYSDVKPLHLKPEQFHPESKVVQYSNNSHYELTPKFREYTLLNQE
jgi:hypothetical protein